LRATAKTESFWLTFLKVFAHESNNVIAQFETERQALALMDRPDIARVFDTARLRLARLTS